ncbi:MAG: hypothetical protein IPO14_13645 [Saprospiraceae bacterium]|nr:hypothetical protein [Saprospiraceae bacterium]
MINKKINKTKASITMLSRRYLLKISGIAQGLNFILKVSFCFTNPKVQIRN